MAPHAKPPGPAGLDTRFALPHTKYLRFIANAEFYGLPVELLRAVGRDYHVLSTTSSAFTNVYTNTLNLNPNTYATLLSLDADNKPGDSGSLQQAYHESTHAYMDLKENDSKFKQFTEDGIKYYTDAPLENGKKSRTPSRLFEEAVGSYVGDRVAVWWRAFNQLSFYDSQPWPTDATLVSAYVKFVLSQESKYNTEMAERVYGYEEKSIVNSEQISTTKPITDAMKTFMDREFLEDKIPDTFRQVSRFVHLMKNFGFVKFNGIQ
jgi:hypothetical protein